MARIATVVGAGLAGCEAAWALANQGFWVTLYEMKPQKYSPAHTYHGFGELVCSNSLKAMRIGSAAGMLKEEMRLLDSLVLQAAEHTAVSAGGALAVDRVAFSDYLTEKITDHPNIRVVHEEVTEIPEGPAVIATGPLTSDALSQAIGGLCGEDYLHFYDAAAPIVSAESLDLDKVFYAARYDRGDADYINCPMDREEYEAFYEALIGGETVQLKEFEKQDPVVYEGCMPIEVLAKRGKDSIRYGPMKPVGLRDPRTGKRPWAVVQLRKENELGTMYNLVGFQTNLKFPEQKRIFSMIPGLERAEFLRYGVMHRNTFLNSPKLLNPDLSLRGRPDLYFAGQMTGVEGYVESAACGILAGINLGRYLSGRAPASLPLTTMLGSLIHYVSTSPSKNFQPMGSNMGLLPPLEEPIREKAARYEAMARRGLADLDRAVEEQGLLDVLC